MRRITAGFTKSEFELPAGNRSCQETVLRQEHAESVLPQGVVSALILATLVTVVVSGAALDAHAGLAQTSRPPSAPARPAESGLTVTTGLAGSVLFLNEVRQGVTNSSGQLSIPRAGPGSYAVRVRTVGYADWKGQVIIAARSTRELKITQQATSDLATLDYQKGDELRWQGNNEEAVSEYKKAVAAGYQSPAARLALARSLITLQKYDEAEEQLNIALKAAGLHRAECETILANLRRYQGLYDESMQLYRSALRLSRGVSPEAHVGLAIALEETGKTTEAVNEYRTGIAQDMDTEPILYYLLGEALEKVERKKEAIEAYSKYLKLDPDGQYASAIASMIEKLKQEPE